MHGEQLKAMLEAVMPDGLIRETVRQLGFQQRQRKLDPVALIRALVLTGGTPSGGRQADALRAYLEQGASKVVRGTFYGWFNEKLGLLMADLGQRACAHARSMTPHLPGPLAGRRDWRAIDSTVFKLPTPLQASFPGTGDYASVKVHKEYSLGVENVVDYHITPGRDHDGPELVIDERRRGTGLLVDLGYASHRLLRDCNSHDVHVIVKLKDGWRVRLNRRVSAEEQAQWVTGSPLEHHFVGTDFVFDEGEPIDIDVVVGPESDPIPVRMVGVPCDKGYCVFLTNLPRSTHDLATIGTLYRLRWCIELDHKLAKTACRLDEISAETPASALIMLHAAMIAAILSNSIVRAAEIARGAIGAHVPPMKEAPLHPMLVAKMLVSLADRLSTMIGNPDVPMAEWDRVAGVICHLGSDPNWRRSPSVLDTVKGRIAKRGRPRNQLAKAGNVA